MKVKVLFFLILMILLSCKNRQENTWDGYWIRIDSAKDNVSYKELDINNDNIVIIINGERIVEKRYNGGNDDFTLKLTKDSLLIISSIYGDKEIYKRISLEKEDKYFTRENLIRKYNYYIQSIDSNDSLSQANLKDQFWEDFDLGGFNFTGKDLQNDDFEVEKN